MPEKIDFYQGKKIKKNNSKLSFETKKQVELPRKMRKGQKYEILKNWAEN